MKIIAVDIGNSNTRLAIVENREVLEKTALANTKLDALPKTLRSFADRLADQSARPVMICSVVPDVCDKISQTVKRSIDSEPLVIGENIPLPLKLDLAEPESVGPDRVVASAMAHERMQTAVAVADFGTAITIDCVDAEGVFLGGTIMPGLRLSAKALAENTARLPLVEPEVPNTPWGRNTDEAISGGLIFGIVGAVREIVERYANRLGSWPELIATGGDARLIARHCDFIHAVVDDLLLMGIELTYDYWQASKVERKG